MYIYIYIYICAYKQTKIKDLNTLVKLEKNLRHQFVVDTTRYASHK